MNRQLLEKASPTRIHALFGLFPRALSELLAAALPVLLERRQQAQERRPDRKRAVGGGRKRRLSPYQEVLMTLLYLRHNVSHEVVGGMFGVSADTSENTFHEVVGVLREVCPSSRWDAEKKWNKSQPSWKPEEVDRLLIDSFETPIRRPSEDARQRRTYSGKKKRHTLKSQVVTDAKGEILEIDAGHRGPEADIRIYESSGVETRYPIRRPRPNRTVGPGERMRRRRGETGRKLAYQTERIENRHAACGAQPHLVSVGKHRVYHVARQTVPYEKPLTGKTFDDQSSAHFGAVDHGVAPGGETRNAIVRQPVEKFGEGNHVDGTGDKIDPRDPRALRSHPQTPQPVELQRRQEIRRKTGDPGKLIERGIRQGKNQESPVARNVQLAVAQDDL